MHPLNHPHIINVNSPLACVPVQRKGKKFILEGGIQIARADTVWAKLPKEFKIIDKDNNEIPPSGQYLITVESIDPYHLITDHVPTRRIPEQSLNESSSIHQLITDLVALYVSKVNRDGTDEDFKKAMYFEKALKDFLKDYYAQYDRNLSK